jgi:hypothetical protein
MPSGIGDYGAANWIGALLGINPVPTGYYVGLCTSEPGTAMDGDVLSDIEPSGGGYGRQRINYGGGNWELGDNYATNTAEVSFGLATADWGLLTHYALLSAPFGGGLFAWGEFLNPVYVQAGFAVNVPAGGIVLALSALDSPIAV